jgi:alkylation response protein AidB-like acyl-CoA dehydrogenase
VVEVVTSDEADVLERVRALVADHAPDDQAAFLGAQFDAGLAKVHYPPGQGGLGLAPNLQQVVDAELAAAGRTASWLRNPMGIGMVAPTLVAHGTDEQRTLLRAIFTAEEIWCQMFSEPGAGSDVATLATRAVRDGDEWVVNGQKVWTSLAHRARWGLLLARTDPDVPKHTGLTAFVIDMHGAGVEVRPLRQMTGGADFNEVYFTDARIPDTGRVGGIGEGWHVAVTTLMNERVSIGGAIAPRGSGPISGALRAWEQAPDRNPARRAELIRLWVEAEVLRLGALRASALRERGTPGPEGSVLKLGGALLDQRIQSFSVSLLGPAGTLSGGYDPPPRDDTVDHFLASQSETIAGGTSEVMRNILGERVLGLPVEAKADRNVPWSQIPKGA